MTIKGGTKRKRPGALQREQVEVLVLAYCRVTDRALPTDTRLAEIIDRAHADHAPDNAAGRNDLIQLIERVSDAVRSHVGRRMPPQTEA